MGENRRSDRLYPEDGPNQSRVDAGALWAGGLVTALIAALAALVALLICDGILDIQLLWRRAGGEWSVVSAAPFAASVAIAALAATGLLHLLVIATPRPTLFFGWIMFLLAVATAVLPFTIDARTDEQVATAVVDVALISLTTMLTQAVAARSVRGTR